MRPDFKDKSPTKKSRPQSSVTTKSDDMLFARFNQGMLSFLRNHWHLHCAALLVVLVAVISVWSVNSSSTTTAALTSDETLADTAITTQTSQVVNKHKWVTLPLALPPSEEEQFKQVLKSHNLISRSDTIVEQTSKADNTASHDTITTDWQKWKVRRGDNLAIMARRHGVKSAEIHYLMNSGEAVNALKRIYPKQVIRVQTSDEGDILKLEYDIKDTQRLVVKRKDTATAEQNPFESTIVDRPYEVQTAFAQGIIKESLFLAGTQAGISDRLTMELAGIYGWDIDFAQDIRAGDKFSLLFEERYRDGERLKGNKSEGAILAAEFVNNGRKIRAIRYTLPDGRTDYFTPEGKSLRKAFLRNPVDFARISSRFNLKRKHPILNKIRAHKGVDYAAPTGTPIRSAGDGKVVFRGKKGGYGNVVIIQHGQRYSTLYAHMSKYARGSNRGKRVRQGQVIGYIGQSGLATGPHLHYEFRVNGVHRNPLTIKHPSVKPIPKELLADFKSATADIIAQLDVVGQSAQYAQLRQ